MSTKWLGYNNVGISAVALMSVLSHARFLTIPKALLVMPLVMHEATIRFLSHGGVRKREAAALASTHPEFFANFSTRFDESLSSSLNAIQLLDASGFLRFHDGLHLLSSLGVDSTFGARAKKIAKAGENIAALLASPVEELYLNFRVQL
ncbi:DUF6521 family protein [Cupriavidus sp. SZY C1]|uniref:three component ABC system middle component n=1 Tax=Cupriavidus sp. SZY C1 TaxID=3055037 RepID=UPI0028B5367C|nr:three component ABC system middle component [Cupriavidus sp. SZY C1]MDT6960780.1 DUF6521 family protein [Cupriavidus sp. SZY C1]